MTGRLDQPLNDQPRRRSLGARLLSASVLMRGGGVACRGPRIAAGALAALIVTLSLFALSPPPAQAHHEPDLLGTTMTSFQWTTATHKGFGCVDTSADTRGRCTNVLGENSFSIDGTSYSITRVEFGHKLDGSSPSGLLRLDKFLPAQYRQTLYLRLGSHVIALHQACTAAQYFPRYDCPGQIFAPLADTSRFTFDLSTEPFAPPAQLELERNAPTRTNSSTRHCGSPDLTGVQALPESTTAQQETKAKILEALAEGVNAAGVDKGHWHCHGELWHQHVDWRARHLSPHQTVRATGDPVVPKTNKAPTAEQTAAGFTSGWHWHGDTHHAHASGVHPHVSASAVPDVANDEFYHWHGTPPDGTYHSHRNGAVYHTH